MALDTQAKKARTLWAENGVRTDPEDVGLDRDTGFTVGYEQVGAGKEPELAVHNQLLRELSGWVRDALTQGSIRSWDSGVNYRHPSFVVGSDGNIYRSLEASGPKLGNATDPTTSGQTVWRTY